MSPETRKVAAEHAQAEFPNEACGLVIVKRGKERFWPCRNIAIDPRDQFILAPEDYAAASEAGEIVEVFHSHVYVPASPSQADRVACEATGLRWSILSLPTHAWAEFEPSGYEAPLIGRVHVWGVVDCWTVVRDWYAREWGIELIDVPRTRDYWLTGDDILGGNVKAAGFYDVPEESDLELGDVLLMQTGDSTVANHCALYIGDDQILHHAEGRLSSREVYGGWYKKHTVRRVRHANRPA